MGLRLAVAVGEFGFIGVASNLSIEAGWQIGDRPPMSALLNSGRSDGYWDETLNVCFRPMTRSGHWWPATDLPSSVYT